MLKYWSNIHFFLISANSLFGIRLNVLFVGLVRNHLLHWFYGKLILSSKQLPLQSHFGIWIRRGLCVQNFFLSVIFLKEDLVFSESTLFVVLFCVCLCHWPQIQILRLFQSSGMRSLLEPTGNRSRINTRSTCLPKSQGYALQLKTTITRADSIYREGIPYLLPSVNVPYYFEDVPIINKFKNSIWVMSSPYLSRHCPAEDLCASSSATALSPHRVPSVVLPHLTSPPCPDLFSLPFVVAPQKHHANQPSVFLISSFSIPPPLRPLLLPFLSLLPVSFTFRRSKTRKWTQGTSPCVTKGLAQKPLHNVSLSVSSIHIDEYTSSVFPLGSLCF